MVGEIKLFGGIKLPNNEFMPCNGDHLEKALYPALFNVIGYSFGGSGGMFALPDMRGRSVLGVSDSGGALGVVLSLGGVGSVGLSSNNLPAHSHNITGNVTVGVNTESPDTEEAGGHVLGKTNADDVVYNEASVSGSLGGVSHNLACAASVGGSVPITVVQPYVAAYYIIRVQ